MEGKFNQFFAVFFLFHYLFKKTEIFYCKGVLYELQKIVISCMYSYEYELVEHSCFYKP